MKTEFKVIDITKHFDICVEARKDSHFCSFETTHGFSDFLDGYRERMSDRITTSEWYYVHVWVDDEIAGQLEFRNSYSEPKTGYIHLFYLWPEFRGTGLAQTVHEYVCDTLLNDGCQRAVLSVSRSNSRALNYYKKHGWQYWKRNPKRDSTDYYELELKTDTRLEKQ